MQRALFTLAVILGAIVLPMEPQEHGHCATVDAHIVDQHLLRECGLSHPDFPASFLQPRHSATERTDGRKPISLLWADRREYGLRRDPCRHRSGSRSAPTPRRKRDNRRLPLSPRNRENTARDQTTEAREPRTEPRAPQRSGGGSPLRCRPLSRSDYFVDWPW